MKSSRQVFQLKHLCSVILTALASLHAHAAYAAAPTKLVQAEFNDEFLQQPGSPKLDLSRFTNSNPTAAGTYRPDIFLNGVWVGRTDVIFRNGDNTDTGASPCFNRGLLELVSVNFEKLSPEAIAAIKNDGNGSCLRLEDLVPDATAVFDNSELRLNVSVPQISLLRGARGYINPELWDKGVNAAILNYNFNAYRSQSNVGRANTSYYLGLNSGVNLGDWHLRNISSMTKQTGGVTRFNNIANYVQRDIVPWKSQLTVGDTFTSGQIFDSLGFRGVALGSDDRMLPDSQTGYAPVVRGIAKSNAKVRVMQGGNILYETTVAPGQFEINDLYSTGYGGDLLVQVTEADGSQSSFTVPYASVAQLLRPGVGRYNVYAGQTRNVGTTNNLSFVQGTYERGLTNDLTLFGGAIAAQDYLSIVGGAAFNTPIGAASVSLTQSHAKVAEQDTRDGQSFRADYSKFVKDTNTNFSLAAYRYSSSGFMRLQDLQAAKSFAASGSSIGSGALDRQRHQLQLMINQYLSDSWGSFYLSGSSQNYWNRPGSSTQYQAGYNNNWRSISYSFSIGRQKDVATGNVNTQYFANISLPLGQEVHSPTLSAGATRDSLSGTSLSSTLNGSLGSDNAFSYGVTASKNPNSSNGSVNAQYRAPYANVGSSYSYGSGGNTQMSAQVSGAVVAHAGGIVLAQSLGETIGIIEAPDAEGAAVNTTGVRIDGRGYAVVPYLTPYRQNEVTIDPKGISTDVELAATSQRVAPHAGAVVLMKYTTVKGRSILIQTKLANGEPVPFGAEVLDEQGNSIGMAGQGGRVFVRTAEADSGKIKIKWGASSKDQCSVAYQLSPRDPKAKGMVYDNVTAVCEPVSEVAKGKDDVKILGKNAEKNNLQ